MGYGLGFRVGDGAAECFQGAESGGSAFSDKGPVFRGGGGGGGEKRVSGWAVKNLGGDQGMEM